MPTFKHGRGAKFYIGELDFSTYSSNVSASATADPAEVSTIGDDDRNFIAGLRGGMLTWSGYFAGEFASNNADSTRLGMSTAAMTFCPLGATVGDRARVGLAHDLTVTADSPVDGVTAMDGSAQLTGRFGDGYVLAAASSGNTTGNGAAVIANPVESTEPFTIAGSKGIRANLHITRNGSTEGGVRLKVQDSSNGSAWADTDIDFNVTSTGITGLSQTSTGLVNRQVRAQVTSIASTSIDYVLAIGRA